MFRRFLIGLATLSVGMLTYFYVLDLIEKRRADIQPQSAFAKARECEETPTSRCLAELAVLHLPLFVRFGGFDRLGDQLRYLGFGDFVDARTKKSEFENAETERQGMRLLLLLIDDIDAFEAEPPHADPFVYSRAFYRLVDDFPGFGGGYWPNVIKAEKAALVRRGPPDMPQLTDPLLRKWRESLDAHADSALDWLFYTSRARELGKTLEAKEALSKAIELGVSDTSDWTLVHETWQLYGLESGLAAIAEIPDTNYRAGAYLNVANRLLIQGDEASAKAVFKRFTESYDEDEPVRLATARRRMARSAALASHRLGDAEQALFWADKYKGSSFASRTVNALEAAELYVDIGFGDKAVANAYEAIEHAPEPGQTARGPWLSIVSTTPYYNSYVGRAIGVLCGAGRFTEAFSLTEDNPSIGREAASRCRVAMEGENPRMTLESLAASLSLHSARQLHEFRASALVEAGEYEAASDFIRKNALATLPEVESGLIAFALSYLRLAVAMRDEDLARDIMRFIAANASSVDGKGATELFATAATYTHKWPDELINK